jgi:Fic-DOC domain mobile mystery protein B
MIKFLYDIGQTPIDASEKLGLIPFITTQSELNILEEENIAEARDWLLERAVLNRQNIFSEQFLKKLHVKMYKRIWNWAGQFRDSEKNIGVESYKIRIELKQLIDDANYWLEHKTYSIIDLAIIFHHRLVKIHLFPNGNGRHARLCADAILAKYGKGEIGWSRSDRLIKDADIRKQYIAALKEADLGNYEPLLAFAKSE